MMNTSESLKNIAAAMIAAQSEIKGMTPDAKNPFFKSNYITLDGILEYVRPILVKNNVWLFQEVRGLDDHISVRTRLVHNTGEFIETENLEMKPQKNDPQQLGSCITYAKRYQLAGLLGISSEVDDDGNKATFGNGSKTHTEATGTNQNSKGTNTQTDNKQTSNSIIQCEKCHTQISEKVAMWSTSSYGKKLCLNCQKKEAKGA